MVLSRRVYRRMSNIKDFCDFDPANQTATLNLNYRSADEIIDCRLSSVDSPVISTSALEMLEGYLEFVPKEFKVNYQIRIADYKGYDPSKIEEAYNKTMEVRDYREATGSSNMKSKMVAFVVVGLIMLLFVIFNSRYKWFAAVGLPLSATIAFILELIFELYFEEGMTHFLVTRLYDKFENDNRFGNITILQ